MKYSCVTYIQNDEENSEKYILQKEHKPHSLGLNNVTKYTSQLDTPFISDNSFGSEENKFYINYTSKIKVSLFYKSKLHLGHFAGISTNVFIAERTAFKTEIIAEAIGLYSSRFSSDWFAQKTLTKFIFTCRCIRINLIQEVVIFSLICLLFLENA